MDRFGVRDFEFLGRAFGVSSFRFRGFGGFWVFGFGGWVRGFRFRGLDFSRFRGLWFWGFRFRVWGSRFRVRGSRTTED